MDGELFSEELIFHLTTAKMQAIKFSSQIYCYMNKNKGSNVGLKIKETKIVFYFDQANSLLLVCTACNFFTEFQKFLRIIWM